VTGNKKEGLGNCSMERGYLIRDGDKGAVTVDSVAAKVALGRRVELRQKRRHGLAHHVFLVVRRGPVGERQHARRGGGKRRKDSNDEPR
jgi:hypothetical protein